jgi:hypothetical protein
MATCATSASSISRAHDLLLERNQSMELNCPDPFADICLAQLRRFFDSPLARRRAIIANVSFSAYRP